VCVLTRGLCLGLTLTVGCTGAIAQNANDILNIFGGLIKSAVVQAALTEWRKLPPSEVACVDQNLRQQGSNLQAAISQGMAPSDPWIAGFRSACRNAVAQQPNPPTQINYQPSIYVVDGLALGGQVKFDSEAYQSYNCVPSEQFAGFTWCQKKRDERVSRGQYTSSHSILHSGNGTALYVNRYLEPAWFTAKEANDDINVRSKKYGAPSRFIPMPQQSNVPNGMIVTWGNVVLQQLDPTNVSHLAAGRNVQVGFMIDHIGNYQRSAQQGLPIYRLVGGAGYVWAASWNRAGVGTLRFLTIDPSAMAPEMPVMSTRVEPPVATIQTEALSGEQARIREAEQARARDAEQARIRDAEQARIRDAEQARVRDAEQARIREAENTKRAAQEEANSNIEYIRATRTRISDRLAMVRNAESKQEIEEISARLATANAEMSSADIKVLRREADSAARILDDSDEFSRVTEIASRRVRAINSVLEKITSDGPVIQAVQAAIKAVDLAQKGSNLRALQDALKTLNDSYDNNRKALQAMQFQSP
jgi:hypothetical protein